ncbi:YqhA family protein [Shewanella youngdeokensis]|uniref:YqhA family protein n=1 Tax=Shewanella youngdeokensis TaxID=2999068 RepID=A0ABZ0JWQ5_9GAMM|nr:YqhA family protein [Shewanella sp. DAU334]
MRELFERFLWGSRLSVMVGVLSCILGAFAVFAMGLKDVFHMVQLVWEYVLTGSHGIRNELVMVVIEILDTFLLGSVLIIFAFGLYELFISNLNEASQSEPGDKILIITSIDSLKSKLGKVILMMLIIKVFSFFAEMKPATSIELLYMGITVVLIAWSLKLSKD